MNPESAIRVSRLAELSEEERRSLLQRAGTLSDEVVPAVRTIIDAVRQRGDAALMEYTERFDGVRLDQLEVQPEEYDRAMDRVGTEVIDALSLALENIRAFHASQLQPQPVVEPRPGLRLWRAWRPIQRIGVYVPGGKAVYPSSVLMNAVPAAVAGCPEVIVCAPPSRDGSVPAATLAAARLAGVSRFFKVGGVQAIAAMAYGTESVPRAYKLFGAGNAYVTAAKMLVFGDADIDMPAGPSEMVAIADDSADPALLAADILAQAEHGADSASLLVTTAAELAEQVAREVALQMEGLPLRQRIRQSLDAYGRILLVDSIEQAVDFTNEYAPEHVEIVTRNPDSVLAGVSNAGSIFLGSYSPVACGDYATGGNHVLPTGGHARTFGPLSVEAFGRWVQVQALTREGLESIRDAVVTIGEAEGLKAHADSVALRFR